MTTTDEIRDTFTEFFVARDHKRLPVGVADPGRARPLGAVHGRGDASAEAVLPGRRATAASARDDLPEDVSHRRHRDHRHDHAAPHVLRDARQLLVRRLLQARGRAVRVGAVARGLRLRAGGHLDHRVRAATRSSGSAPTRRRSRRGSRWASRASGSSSARARRTSGRPGPTGPCGPCSELYLDRGLELRQARRSAGRRERAVPRVLEPRVHAARPEPGQRAHAASGQEHRHRAGAQPPRGDPPGQADRVRDRPVRAADRARARSCRAAATGRTSPPTGRCGCSPTTAAR